MNSFLQECRDWAKLALALLIALLGLVCALLCKLFSLLAENCHDWVRYLHPDNEGEEEYD